MDNGGRDENHLCRLFAKNDGHGCRAAELDFAKWFEGSKVVDQKNNPLVVFHMTEHDFEQFLPLSHFGSNRTAHKRIHQCLKNDKDIKGPMLKSMSTALETGAAQTYALHSVFLRMKNPLMQKDLNIHSRENYREDLTQRKIIESDGSHIFPAPESVSAENARWEMNQDPVFPGLYRTPENLWKHRMIKALEKQGYDGIVYQNMCEDRGTVSYIIFRPEQVVSAYMVNRGSDQKLAKYISSRIGANPKPPAGLL